MKEMVIGTLTGISALIATMLVVPRRAEVAPAIWEMRDARTSQADGLGSLRGPSTRPDPARLKLEKEIDRVKVERVALSKLIDFIAQATGANIQVDWRALEAAGINGDSPCTINLQHLPARVMLRAILDNTGGKEIRLAYGIEEGIVRISTAEDLSKYAVTRVYNLRDLIEDAQRNDPKLTRQEAAENLIGVMGAALFSAVWDGPQNRGIREWNGLLIVTMPVEDHDLLSELLANLRAKIKSGISK